LQRSDRRRGRISPYSYVGDNGPSHWAATCNAGQAQSPIDIKTADLIHAALPQIETHYSTSLTNLPYSYDGHTVQVPIPPGNYITVAGHRYDLVQIHFHYPSEHTVDGWVYSMELHLVHRDAQGNLLVLGVLLSGDYTFNTAYAPLTTNVPSASQPNKTTTGTLNLAALLPSDRTYYAYSGSLTTPPGTETVSWAVFAAPVFMNIDQFTALQAVMSPNARPMQPVNSRPVFISS